MVILISYRKQILENLWNQSINCDNNVDSGREIG